MTLGRAVYRLCVQMWIGDDVGKRVKRIFPGAIMVECEAYTAY